MRGSVARHDNSGRKFECNLLRLAFPQKTLVPFPPLITDDETHCSIKCRKIENPKPDAKITAYLEVMAFIESRLLSFPIPEAEIALQ